MKHILILAALLLGACIDDPPPSAAQSRQWDAERRTETSRTIAADDAWRRAVQRQEKLKQDWIARGRPPSPWQR
jgi:hypothetical protein